MHGRAAGRIVGLFLVTAAGGGTARAQSVRGVVLDIATRKGIPGATVQIEPDSTDQRRTISDSAGNFRLSLAGPGLYTVSATRIGYLRHTGDTIRVGEAETVSLRIELDQNAVPLHPIIITDRLTRLPNGFEQRRAAGFGRFMDRDDIDKRHASKTTDLFRGMLGVQLTPLPRGLGLVLQLRKMAGVCRPAIWVDGLPMGETNQSLDLMIQPEVVEAIEVYTSVSTAPVQYRNGNCGVVLFWTRHVPEESQPKPKGWKKALGVTAAIGLLLVSLVGRT